MVADVLYDCVFFVSQCVSFIHPSLHNFFVVLMFNMLV
jgi:hypothetical protein